MRTTSHLAQIFSLSTLSLIACTTSPDATQTGHARDHAADALQHLAGAPVALEMGATGDLRVLATTPQFSVPGHATDPVQVATGFLAAHHDVLQLDAGDASQFVVTRVDNDRAGDLRHVTLQRVFNGIPVFQGAITVHMDSGNGVFRVLGDESYHIAPPTNRMVLGPVDAATAAARALGVTISPTLTEGDGLHAVFESPGLLDPMHVDPQIVHVSDGDDRFAFQATVSWLDDQNQQQYQLVLLDAQDGALLGSYSLVDTFQGKVFNVNAQPTANQSTDTRTEVSFDGNPAASPSGWVTTPGNKTIGNNAVAATDLNGNNTVGTNETQPTAVNNAFDFPYSATQDASNFKAAAVANAFFLVNDYHDRTYLLGFTEASGNFQTNNFGKGGAQNDPVNVDAQDGSGTNNANFSTPPDGSRPRMQMFVFNVKNGAGGVTQDGDFDPSVIYHESTHGLSNRLVGGGSTACLGGLQSGGMGEGWGDFMASSFLNNPVIGAYVTGNAFVGARRVSMANSSFSFSDIKTGALADVHDVGELWAAALWSARTEVGAAAMEQLVVTGMKLTPCNPTMLQARDAILQADANLFAGANTCKLWKAFAARLMGTRASSPNHNSTTTIVTSNTVPIACDEAGRECTVVIPKPADAFDCKCKTIDRDPTTRCATALPADQCTTMINTAVADGLLTPDAVTFLQDNGFCPIVLDVGLGPQIYDFCPRGCFAADTQILTSATGDDKASYLSASQFTRQDTLMSMADEATLDELALTTRPIERVVHGPEEPPLFVFTLANGSTLRVTQHHPMVLDNGKIIEAAQVGPGVSFVGVDGQPVAILSITREKATDDVFNFQAAGETLLSHVIVAEGVLVGDLKLQNELAAEQGSIALRR